MNDDELMAFGQPAQKTVDHLHAAVLTARRCKRRDQQDTPSHAFHRPCSPTSVLHISRESRRRRRRSESRASLSRIVARRNLAPAITRKRESTLAAERGGACCSRKRRWLSKRCRIEPARSPVLASPRWTTVVTGAK